MIKNILIDIVLVALWISLGIVSASLVMLILELVAVM